MVATQTRTRKPRPLVTAALLTKAAAHGCGLDTRHLDHWHPSCEARADLRAQAEGLVALHVRGLVWCVASGSHPGECYTVIANGHTRCDCDAGRSGKMCKHTAIVNREIARRQEASRVEVSDPIAQSYAEDRTMCAREAW
jgi:hypothetical protein